MAIIETLKQDHMALSIGGVSFWTWDRTQPFSAGITVFGPGLRSIFAPREQKQTEYHFSVIYNIDVISVLSWLISLCAVVCVLCSILCLCFHLCLNGLGISWEPRSDSLAPDSSVCVCSVQYSDTAHMWDYINTTISIILKTGLYQRWTWTSASTQYQYCLSDEY